jgi:hypothetical protein
MRGLTTTMQGNSIRRYAALARALALPGTDGALFDKARMHGRIRLHGPGENCEERVAIGLHESHPGGADTIQPNFILRDS